MLFVKHDKIIVSKHPSHWIPVSCNGRINVSFFRTDTTLARSTGILSLVSSCNPAIFFINYRGTCSVL